MKFWVVILTFSLGLLIGGCDQISSYWPTRRSQKVVEKAEFDKYKDVDLAKIVLKRKKERPKIDRDPFAPLMGKTERQTVKPSDKGSDLRGLEYLGVVKNQDAFFALLKFESKRMVKSVNDKVKGYTIIKIEPDKVVLTNGIKTKTVKRGVEK